jgi:iron complex outermembrane receptor protein
MYEVEGKFRIGYEAYYTGRKYLSSGETTRPYWLMGLMAEKKWQHFSLFINFENLLDIRQNRYEEVVQGSISNPTFREVWAPLEGFITNGGVKLTF